MGPPAIDTKISSFALHDVSGGHGNQKTSLRFVFHICHWGVCDTHPKSFLWINWKNAEDNIRGLLQLSHCLIGHQDMLHQGNIRWPWHCHGACCRHIRTTFFSNPKQRSNNATKPCRFFLIKWWTFLLQALFRQSDCLELFSDIALHAGLDLEVGKLTRSATNVLSWVLVHILPFPKFQLRPQLVHKALVPRISTLTKIVHIKHHDACNGHFQVSRLILSDLQVVEARVKDRHEIAKGNEVASQ